MHPYRGLAIAMLPLLLAAVACAPTEDSTDGSASPSASASATSAADCTPDKLDLLQAGALNIGTDSPAYEPWFSGDDPTNGKGYESAVAYAVAEELGFARDDVKWVKVPFNSSYAPGAKKFDFDINQISITPARAKVVDFSDGYYAASQAVIAVKGSKAAGITSVADLKDLKLGAQTGTTSLTAITDVIEPAAQPAIFDDTNQAKQSLLNGQVDAILADLPTAFYITSVEIPKATIVGQFQPETGRQEEFGLLFEKGSGLVPCVDQALATLKEDGTLARLEKRWLSDVVDVPVLEVVAEAWTPSDRQRERLVTRRRLDRRSQLVATVTTVVVLGLLVLGLVSSPGWPRVRETFLSWPDAKAAFPPIAEAFWLNVRMFLVAEPLILLVGMLVAVARGTTAPALFPVRALAVVYTDLFRGLPTLLVVFLVCFGLPALQLQGIPTSLFWLGVLALVLCYGAYVAEVFRSGIDSVHPSQVASAQALGLSHGQSLRFVVLPQAVRRVVPPLLNDFVSLQKDTALVASVGLVEALRQAQVYSSFNFNFTSYLVAGAFFVALTVPLARVTDWLARRSARRERAGAR